MLLKSTKTVRPVLKRGLNILEKRKVLVGAVLFILYTVLVLGAGYVLKKHDFYGQFLKPVFSTNYRMVVNYIQSFSVEREKITIDIKHKHFLKIAYRREEALKRGRLFYSPGDDEITWVPATLTHRGKSVRADIRLKGSEEEHWKDEHAWSFKVNVKGGDTLFGMKRFALQGPWTRTFMNEWYWHKLLRHSGLIAQRFDFVDVTLNGKHLPVYAIEENYEKRLLENNHLREGPIFLARTGSWGMYGPGTENVRRFREQFLTLKAIDFYQPNKYSQNAEFMKLVHAAESRVEAYRQGSLPFSKVFDVDKMGKLLALTDLVGSPHTLSATNSRYYFNPVTRFIEPIASDNSIPLSGSIFNIIGSGQRFASRASKGLSRSNVWPLAAFRDKVLFKKYIEALEEVSDENFLDRFFLQTKDEAQEKLKVLHRSYPYYEFGHDKNMYKNAKLIREQLQPSKSLNIYYEGVSEEEDVLYLDIASTHIFPVEILGISLDDNIVIKPLQETIVQAKRAEDGLGNYVETLSPTLKNMKEIVLKEVKSLTNLFPMTSVDERKVNQKATGEELSGLEYEKVEFRIPEGFKWSDSLVPRLRVISRVFGAKFRTPNAIIPWARHEGLFVQPPNIKETSFVSVDEGEKLIRFKRGKWIVEHDIIIPAGYRVIAEQGTHFDLADGAKILSYSAVEFIGSKENPIVISSKGYSGQGMVVLGAKKKSKIQYTNFDGLSSPSRAGWALTGAVTFYESPVAFLNVKFINNQSEDALNLIRSEFTMENAVFRNSSSDGLDSDFSHGVIRNTSFLNSGNDALDASGSDIHVESIFLNGIGDKGISAGEKSKVVVGKLEGENSRIAVASKDYSEVIIKKAKLKNFQIGLVAFQKKSEFGPGAIEVQALEMDNIGTPYLVEEGSSVKVDGVSITSRVKNVGKFLYDG